MSNIKLPPFHPLAELFPLMPDDSEEFAGLVADIKEHTQRQSIDTWGGKIIDGRNRARACQKLGIEPKYHECRFSNEDGARAYVISQNIHRRHLTAEQKRDIIAALLKADPTKSDREHARTAKVSHHTVAAVRSEQESRGQIAHVDKRTDTKGRQQPAKKPPAQPKVDGKQGMRIIANFVANDLLTPERRAEIEKTGKLPTSTPATKPSEPAPPTAPGARVDNVAPILAAIARLDASEFGLFVTRFNASHPALMRKLHIISKEPDAGLTAELVAASAQGKLN